MTAALTLPDATDLLALLLRSTLLMGAAWTAATTLHKAGASAAARHTAWLLGTAALLALPVLWFLLPALRLPVLPAEAATAAVSAASSPAMAPSTVALAGPNFADAPIRAGWGLMLAMVYALGTAALLLRLVAGRRMLARLWSGARLAGDPAWEKLLSQLSSQIGLSRRVELRIARGPAVPMTWGTLAPKLLLPAEASQWPQERRRLVLLHELAHVARRDSLSRSLASLACALYWFHPGAWLAARQMRLEQEHAADDRVLTAGGSAQAYALSLLHLARGMRAGPQFEHAAAMAGMDQLERRLVSITSPARRDQPGTVFLSSSVLLAALATMVVAAGVPVSASPTPIGSEGAKRADFGSRLAKGLDLLRAEDGSARETRKERGGSSNSLERSNESAAVSGSPVRAPAAEAAEIAERGQARGDRTVSRQSEPTSSAEEGRQDRRQSPAYADQLRDYGWELRRRDSQLETGSRETFSRPARIAMPTPIYSASSDRTGPPKWTRSVPRLVRGRPPTGLPVSSSEGPLVLSWSLEVGGK